MALALPRSAAALNPLAPLRRRFRQWWQGRLPLTDTLLLTQRNVYILPTGSGWMLALTLLVLLVASINFQLNLGYLLTFLLAGSAVIGMHVCHANLRGLTLHLKTPEPHFMGTSTAFEIQLSSERKTPRYGIALAVHDTGQEPIRSLTIGPGPTCLPRGSPACRWPSSPPAGACTGCPR